MSHPSKKKKKIGLTPQQTSWVKENKKQDVKTSSLHLFFQLSALARSAFCINISITISIFFMAVVGTRKTVLRMKVRRDLVVAKQGQLPLFWAVVQRVRVHL